MLKGNGTREHADIFRRASRSCYATHPLLVCPPARRSQSKGGHRFSRRRAGRGLTLATEFQYYLVLPLIALAISGLLYLTRLKRPERRLWVIIGSLLVMVLWGLGTRWWGESFVVTPHAFMNKVLFVVYGDHGKFFEDFAIGMLIALCFTFLNKSPRKERYLLFMKRLVPWLVGLCVLLYAFAAMRDYVSTWHYIWPIAPRVFQAAPWATECIFALSYGCVVLAALFGRPGGPVRRVFEWTPLRWIGLISYSLYIWHEPLLLLLQNHLGPTLAGLNHALAIVLSGGLVLVVSLVFCFFAYLLIEKPGMQLSECLRQRMLQRRSEKVTASEPIVPPGSLNSSEPANGSAHMATRAGAAQTGTQGKAAQAEAQARRAGLLHSRDA